MDRDGLIEIRLPNNVAYICALRAFVKSIAARLEFTDEKIGKIELAIDELCNNAMEHGSDKSSVIIVKITPEEYGLQIKISDDGSGLSPLEFIKKLQMIRRKPVSPYGERGHGIYIVENLADHFSLSLNENGGVDARVVFYKSDFDNL